MRVIVISQKLSIMERKALQMRPSELEGLHTSSKRLRAVIEPCSVRIKISLV